MEACIREVNDEVLETQHEIFNNIGRILTSSLDPGEVFRRVMMVIGEYFAPQYWSLLLIDEDSKGLKFELVMGVDANTLSSFYLKQGEGIAGWVYQNGEPLVVEDVRTDPRFSSRVDDLLKFETRSVVCVPLLNGKNQIMGVIELINKIAPEPELHDSESFHKEVRSEYRSFTKRDMAILSSIGAFTGIAAENAFLHQKVVELAMIDSLTGLNNRHYFYEIFDREVERVARYGQTICVLMIDIDRFKIINDTFGHLTGDKVLCAAADILKSSVRKSDVVARFGGDEFVILMPQADEHDGQIVAKRIQSMADEWNEKSAVPGMNMGISIGVHGAGPEDVRDILQKADQKLYRNKSYRKKAEELLSEDQVRRFLWESISSGSHRIDLSP